MKSGKQIPLAIEEAFDAMDATIKPDEMLKHSMVISRYLNKRKDQYIKVRYDLSMCRYYTFTKGYDKIKTVVGEFSSSRIATKDPMLMGMYHYHFARLCFYENNNAESLLHAEQGLAIFKQLNNSKWQCHCLIQIYTLSVATNVAHQYEILELLWQIVSLCEASGLIDEVTTNHYVHACSGIATQYLIEENYQAAHNFLQTPLQKLTALNSLHVQGIEVFIGEAYFYEKKYPEALKIFTSLYHHEFRKVNYSFNLHISFMFLACHTEMGSIKEYMQQYNEFITLADQTNTPYDILKTLSLKLHMAALEGDTELLQQHIAKGEKLLEKNEMGDSSNILFHHSVARAYELIGDYKAGWESMKQYTYYATKNKANITDKKIEVLNSRIEMTKKAKENELLKKELEINGRELELTATFLKKKNALIDDMLSLTTTLCKKHKHQNGLFEIKKKLVSIKSDDDDRDRMKELLDKNNQEYIKKITTQYSAITSTEAKICALIKAGLSNKEIASLLVTSPRTVDTHRSNVRKKMGLGASDNLERILRAV